MNRILLVIFLTLGLNTFGQDVMPTKSKLLTLFKKSISQNSKSKISVDSNPWIICNKDSAFYNSDTLKLVDNDKYYYQSGCCDFIDWTFYKKNAFILTKAQICKEPPTNSVTKKNDWFTVDFKSDNRWLILEIYNEDKLVDRFRVISIGKVKSKNQTVEDTNTISLVRIREIK